VVSFVSDTQLLPKAIPGVENAYEWDHGSLRLAGILPNGKVPSGGSTPPEEYRAGVSDDGSRVTFISPLSGNKQLYMRRNHSNTVWISESESSLPVEEPEQVELQWISPDAHHVLFTTTSRLLDEDENEARDLYLYTETPNPAGEQNLQLVSAADPITGGVIGASDDASRIYYGGEFGGGLILWEDGQSRLAFRARPLKARVSPDGRYVAFLNPVEGFERNLALTGQDVRANTQMYAFDAVNQTLSCASCAATGVSRGGVPPVLEVNYGGLEKDVHQLRPRFLSADGRRVFFSTSTALVPNDTNGVLDVYVLDTRTGDQQLVSSGKGEHDAWFANASSSGNDAFFLTYQPLLGADPDDLVDLYDSRVDGGFAEPPPPPTPCAGDNCRGPLPAASGARSPATATFEGPGNCHRKVKRHHRRHHNNHHKKHRPATCRRAGGKR
jgi:hypothetical protein